jgi:hypothetical protein
MSLERDLQSKVAAIDTDLLTFAGATSHLAGVVDTLGFRNLVAIIIPSRAINLDPSVEHFHIIGEDSPDAVTYTAIDHAKYLPTRHDLATGQLLFNGVAPYFQTIGIFSVERYVNLGVRCDTYSAPITFKLILVAESELQDFLGYDPSAPAGDGLP